jgi:hypothetical protein
MASAHSAEPKLGFLHLLEHLAEDAWAQALLPKLLAGGSAANLALTCTTMRTHVQGNVGRLSWKAQHIQGATPMQLEAWTAAVPQHFPKCVSVHLSLPDDSSYMGVSALLPAVARQVGCTCRMSTVALVLLSVLHRLQVVLDLRTSK